MDTCSCTKLGAKTDGWSHRGHQLWVHTVCGKPSKGFLAIYQANQAYMKANSKDPQPVSKRQKSSTSDAVTPPSRSLSPLPDQPAPRPERDQVTSQSELLVARPKIERSRGGRPIIQKPDGTLADYTRCSSLGNILDDRTKLEVWTLRQTIIGICSRQQYVVAVNAHSLDNDELDKIIEQGQEAAGMNDASTAGTAVHRLVERIDGGEEIFVDTDSEYFEGVESYLWATVGLETVVAEEFGVCDELEAAGTPDRIYRLRGDVTMPDGSVLKAGTLVVGDVKTCKTLDYGEIDFGVQLALYARSKRYDIGDGKTTASWKRRKVPVGVRSDWVPGEVVNTKWAIIVWIPSGVKTAQLRPVDLTLGWELAQLAETVRLKRKAVDNKVICDEIRIHEDYERTLRLATSLDELTEAYKRAVLADEWTAELKEMFSEKKEEIMEEAA